MIMVYVYLKYSCDGYFMLPKGSISCHASALKLSIPTFKKQLKELIRLKWIVINGKRKAYRVIGFVSLAKKLKFESYKAVEFEQKNFQSFKEFIIASVLTYFMEFKRRNERKSEYSKRCSIMNLLSPSFSHTLPNKYLAKVLNISISTASEYKQLAADAGYVKIRKRFSKLPIPITIPRKGLIAFLQETRINPLTVRKIKGSYFEQKPDLIESKLEIKTKTNLKKALSKQKNFRYDNKRL